MTLQQLYLVLLISGTVLLASIAAARLAARIGLPSLLLFLAVGVVIGEDVLGVPFDDAQLAQALGTCALGVILVEGGPQLIGDFFAERCLDELFLTLAPQVAGRDDTSERPGLVAGKRFAPEHPIWGTLVGVKRGGSHLFLRYAFGAEE